MLALYICRSSYGIHLSMRHSLIHCLYCLDSFCSPISAATSCLSASAAASLGSTSFMGGSSFLRQQQQQHFHTQAQAADMAASKPPATRMVANPSPPAPLSSSDSGTLVGRFVNGTVGANVGPALGAAVGDDDGKALGLRVG